MSCNIHLYVCNPVFLYIDSYGTMSWLKPDLPVEFIFPLPCTSTLTF